MTDKPKHRQVFATGDEQDCHSRKWKSLLKWKAGQRKAIKKRTNRKERRLSKKGITIYE